jgi:hypothetical protein
MVKMVSSLIALSVAGMLALSASTPTFAKGNAKVSNHRLAPPSSQQARRPLPAAPFVHRCRHGVWDPYGVRCDRVIE